MTETRRQEIGNQAFASFMSKSRTGEVSMPLRDAAQLRRTRDKSHTLHGPNRKHAHGRLNAKKQKGHREVGA